MHSTIRLPWYIKYSYKGKLIDLVPISKPRINMKDFRMQWKIWKNKNKPKPNPNPVDGRKKWKLKQGVNEIETKNNTQN